MDMDTAWMQNARCRGADPNIFFIDTKYVVRIKALKEKYCNQCPVKVACFNFGVTTHSGGIWGGKTEEERDMIVTWRGIQAKLPVRDSSYANNNSHALPRQLRVCASSSSPAKRIPQTLSTDFGNALSGLQDALHTLWRRSPAESPNESYQKLHVVPTPAESEIPPSQSDPLPTVTLEASQTGTISYLHQLSILSVFSLPWLRVMPNPLSPPDRQQEVS